MARLIVNKHATLQSQYRSMSNRIVVLSQIPENKISEFQREELKLLEINISKIKTKLVLLGIEYEQ